MSTPDRNFCSYANETNLDVRDKVIDPRQSDIDPSIYDDLFKLSHCTDVTVAGCKIRGGGLNREDGVDINNECRNVAFQDCEVEAGQLYAFTIKGGSKVIILSDIIITRPGKHVDIDIGNWSDQSWAKTDAVVLSNVRRVDGEPVRVRVGRATKPVINGGNIKILFWSSLALKGYVYGKYAVTKIF